jgi:drug/metabolite transporter (DMT)-like permease
VTLFATWAFGIAPANFKTLGNVAIIVLGVVIASFGEIKFDMLGFLIQCAGIIFEALRLVMVQRLLSSAEFKMDPLVSLYYYAPACAVTNGIVTLFTDVPRMTMNDIYSLGIMTLIANALVAFLLNASVVLLVCGIRGSFNDYSLTIL